MKTSDFGPQITTTFDDGNGVKTAQTPIKYRGAQIGEVPTVAILS